MVTSVSSVRVCDFQWGPNCDTVFHAAAYWLTQLCPLLIIRFPHTLSAFSRTRKLKQGLLKVHYCIGERSRSREPMTFPIRRRRLFLSLASPAATPRVLLSHFLFTCARSVNIKIFFPECTRTFIWPPPKRSILTRSGRDQIKSGISWANKAKRNFSPLRPAEWVLFLCAPPPLPADGCIVFSRLAPSSSLVDATDQCRVCL